MDAIWKRAAELKVPMCILCPIGRIPDVERVIARHDGKLDVCIDHMADCPIDQPDELKKLLALARYPRVYVKLSHLWLLSQAGRIPIATRTTRCAGCTTPLVPSG